MGIAKDKKRYEVHLKEEIVSVLQKQADNENRSLKNLMESIIIQYVNNLKNNEP